MARMHKYGESKMTQVMMATVPHVTSSLGLRKFQADGFLLTRVYPRVCKKILRFVHWRRHVVFCTMMMCCVPTVSSNILPLSSQLKCPED